MSKIDLVSREWCDLVFEGRNKDYGAYRMRANSGRRQAWALIYVILGILVIGVLVALSIVVKDSVQQGQGDEYTAALEMSKLKEEKKPEEKKEEKIELKYEKPVEKVAVKASIQFTVPKIVDDDQVREDQEMKTMDELISSKAAIGSQTYKGDEGGTINIDDLKDNQQAGGTATPEEEPDVFTVVEQPPTFPGGEAALLRYVSEHVKYPAIAQEQEIQGTVVLRFVVLEDGSIGDVIIQRGLDPSCDKEAVRVVKSLPRFVPGKQQGRPVKVWFTLPIRFIIQ